MTSFVLTVDVEIDAGRKWKTADPATYRGVTEGIPRLQALCDDYGVKPVYLISPAVMVDPPSVDVLRGLDERRSELGAHLHGEYVPPLKRFAGEDFSGCDPGEMQCEYSESIEFAKLRNLTDAFKTLFGYPPRSFRAGRFAARGWTVACLEALGYTHDSSVTPFRNWYDRVDFSKPGSLSPYHPSKDDICQPGVSSVIEVPVSITPDVEWLRPTPRFADFERCKRVIDWYGANTDPTVLCCMFHNVELVPGMSPYCRTEQDCDGMFAVIEQVFAYLHDENVAFKTLSEVTLDG
ncbi:MAG: hypothetical protein OEU92_30765 [Alphaproteobacteria bacterium]|nr:hypothetical protein [Alphaproteobacteria bacterium]